VAGEQQQTRQELETEIKNVRGQLMRPWEFTSGDEKDRALARLVELEGKRLAADEADQAKAAAAAAEARKREQVVLAAGERIRAAKTPEERAEAMKALDALAAAERAEREKATT
jgi:hypothetical protein